MVKECLSAANELATQNIDAEIIDIATLSPFDPSQVLASVEKTGRCAVVHEAIRTSGFGAEVLATISELGLMTLLAPLKRVTAPDTVVPLARLEQAFFPSTESIIKATHELMVYA